MNSPKLNSQACPPRQTTTVDGWAFAQSPAVETARLLALALPGDHPNPCQAAFDGLAALNKRLVDAPTEEIRQALARQATLLEALALSYTRRALEARQPEHVAMFQGLALKCQRSHLNVLGALHKMSQDQGHAIEAD